MDVGMFVGLCVGRVCVCFPVVLYAEYRLRTQLRQTYTEIVKSLYNKPPQKKKKCERSLLILNNWVNEKFKMTDKRL